MKPILLVGIGKVGAFILEQAKDFPLYVVDVNEAALKKCAQFPQVKKSFLLKRIADLSTLIAKQTTFSIAISCVPGAVGYEVAKRLLQQGISLVDVSFYKEDPFTLTEVCKKNGVFYIPDAGIAPGFSNMFLGWCIEQQAIKRFEYFVAGLPQCPRPPFYYEAPFHPKDALEEYLRPARVKQQGEVRAYPPLHWIKQFHGFPQKGVLYGFLSDGLRTLLKTTDVLEMYEWTLRYPQHLTLIQQLDALGFLTWERLDTLAQWLAPWLTPKQKDITLMYCIAETQGRKRWELSLVHEQQGVHLSMSVVTGTVAWVLAKNALEQGLSSGIHPPEYLSFWFDAVKRALEQQGAVIQIRELLT